MLGLNSVASLRQHNTTRLYRHKFHNLRLFLIVVLYNVFRHVSIMVYMYQRTQSYFKKTQASSKSLQLVCLRLFVVVYTLVIVGFDM